MGSEPRVRAANADGALVDGVANELGGHLAQEPGLGVVTNRVYGPLPFRELREGHVFPQRPPSCRGGGVRGVGVVPDSSKAEMLIGSTGTVANM